MAKAFKEFILRGNVIALAIAVVIGVAFAAVITSFVEDILTPLIAAIGGQPDFSDLTFTVNDSIFRYGEFVNSVIAFLIIAAVVFFLVVVPLDHYLARSDQETSDEPPEYSALTAGSADALAEEINRRTADGWRVVSMTDGPGGREVTAVLIKE